MNEILRQIREGNFDRFYVLYEIFFRNIYSFIYYITKNQKLTEIIIKKVFVRVLGHISEYRGCGSGLNKWIYKHCRAILFHEEISIVNNKLAFFSKLKYKIAFRKIIAEMDSQKIEILCSTEFERELKKDLIKRAYHLNTKWVYEGWQIPGYLVMGV